MSPKRSMLSRWACPTPASPGPPHPEEQKPPAVEETPRAAPKAEPLGKAQPFLGAQPLSFPQGPQARPPLIIQPLPILLLPFGPAPASQGPPPAPVSTRRTSSPLHKAVPLGLGGPELPPHEHGGSSGAWAHPHLDQLGSHRALIQTVDEFKTEFLAAFGDPDATRAAERKITSLTQTGTCAEYITKFARCKWNSIGMTLRFAASSRGDFTGRELQDASLIIDNALREERASHPQQGNKSGKSSTTPIGGQVPANRPPKPAPSLPTPTTSRKKNVTAAAQKASVRHVIILTPSHRGITRIPLIDLPTPRTVTMLDGSSPQAGKIWKKANLTFSFDGKRMTETFLICNTGSHAAILGLKWLDAHNPEIDWNSRTLSFPHAPPEHVAIAEEEEADQNPLKESPPSTINMPSMTDAESATLKDWLRDELKAGKIRPSKSSISSPVMFVPKKDGSRRLVVDYRRLNNRTKKNVYPYPHFMNKLFKDLLDVCVIIYLDDILIYSKDDATHTQHVHEVLRRLMENQLFCKASKCTFHVTSVEYLGIIVSDKGFSLDKLKIQAVQEWPTPTKVKEVQSFLGPLHNLVKKDTTWNWGPKEQEAFQGLKDAITNAPVLCHADPAKPYFLENGCLRCSIRPDTTSKSSTAPGNSQGKPDALSRRSDHADIPPEPQSMLPEPVFANIALVLPEKELQKRIESSLDQDESLEEILRFLENESKAPPSIKKAFKDYQMEAGLLFYQGRIVVPDVGTLRTDLLRIFHDSPLAGHPGRQRTLELVSRNYYWPGIRADTYWHVDTCETCQRIRKPKYASIPPQPLELPVRPWQHVSYDMIVDLPKDGGNDSILVIVDSFTKYGIFVKCSKKLKAPELAELFLEHVWKRHGMPEKTVSDREGDGQTEQVNPSIEHFLRAYSGVNQRDWTKWLPMAEFAYNNAVHSSTGKTPFKALYEADDLASTMEAQWREVEAALRQAKARMIAGESGNPLEFEIGEEAWLDAKNVNLKTLSPKLTEQRLGPFKVIEKISNRAYRLELPPTMRIHNVFYVGLLSKVKRNDKRAFENRPPPVTVDGEEEYEVEGITDAEERDGNWFFRVKWKGYGSEENTWEPRENLKNAEKILKKYKKEMKKKALGAAKALRGGQCRRHN
ncbi:hypothetical protein RHS01_01538 [Rhizoctonia solani]|uniref:Uncharacterized protein n=1 Tax=Rhizoctonia solani TaxID=456999 RepID=A0A8H7M9G1_9AGAM|nr:hypothetical protein RHS01_01538 [Rhizoctonia solani]